MTTQARNRILALLVIGSLFVILTGFIFQNLPVRSYNAQVTSGRTITVADIEAAPKLNQAEFECLRANVYFEARTESLKGMQAVAFVAVNRAENKHYPNTICDVVKQSALVKYKAGTKRICQFSWYCDGKPDVPNLYTYVKAKQGKKFVKVRVLNVAEVKAWQAADIVAREVMEGKVHNFLAQATHYHAVYVHPSWRKAKRFQELTRIGAHIFYMDKGLFRKA